MDSRFDLPGTEGAGITVRRALELPGLRSGLPEVLAGADRLGRTVRWVHAGEVPNIASLLKGGELLLTTGYGLGTRPAEQRAFVRTLAERGIAAQVGEGLRGPHKEDPPPAGSVLVDVPGGGPGTAGSVRARLVLLPVRSPLSP